MARPAASPTKAQKKEEIRKKKVKAARLLKKHDEEIAKGRRERSKARSSRKARGVRVSDSLGSPSPSPPKAPPTTKPRKRAPPVYEPQEPLSPSAFSVGVAVDMCRGGSPPKRRKLTEEEYAEALAASKAMRIRREARAQQQARQQAEAGAKALAANAKGKSQKNRGLLNCMRSSNFTHL
jgi:hypothetical protein